MNNVIKKMFGIAMCAITTASLVSCNNKGNDPEQECLKKINDYLYAVEYEDYDFMAGVKRYEDKFGIATPGCTEVRKGQFVGRNLDWYINCDLAAIIRVDRKGNPETDDFNTSRYASIGMVGCMSPFSTEAVKNTTDYLSAYEFLPFSTCDGINENGVYIGSNVTATGETSMDPNNWKYNEYGVGADYTNKSSDKKFCVTYLVRVILDHAKSVEDAIRIVNSISWYEPKNFPKQGETQAFHWLLADKYTNCVLEFIDNKPVFVITTDLKTPSFATIMTNFNNYLWERGITQDHGIGYERFDLMMANYNDVPETAEGMETLMEKVWYTKSYTMNMDEPGFWTTEFTNDYYTAPEMYQHPEVLKDENFRKVVEKSIADYNDKSKWHTPTCGVWYTTHTSIYDLDSLSLRVKLHEGLDGMKSYYAVKFNDRFPNPLAKRPK